MKRVHVYLFLTVFALCITIGLINTSQEHFVNPASCDSLQCAAYPAQTVISGSEKPDPRFPDVDVDDKKTRDYQLYEKINAYRKTKGLPSIPYSKKLAKTAQLHVNYAPVREAGTCNGHSWAAPPASAIGAWEECCVDSKRNACNDKAKRVAGYPVTAFEIYGWGNGRTPDSYVKGWSQSPGHNAVVIAPNDTWKLPWNALGCGITGSRASCYFGTILDPS